MTTIRSWQVGIGFVAMVLSMVIVFQLRTESKIRAELPTRNVPELSRMFHNQKAQLEKYEHEINDLRKQLKEYDRDREMSRLRMAAGLIALTGSGIRIELNDSDKVPKNYEDPIFYVVHYDQLELLINELWAAGAEAIAVNGHRIGGTTGLSCAGTTILVDTKRLAPPFIIEAIGDPENLESALKMRGGFVEQQILAFNLRFTLEKVEDLTIPAYKGTISFEHARPAEVR